MGLKSKDLKVKFHKTQKCLERFKFKLLTWTSIKFQPNITPWYSPPSALTTAFRNVPHSWDLTSVKYFFLPNLVCILEFILKKIALSLLFYLWLIQRHVEPFKTWSSLRRRNLQNSFASHFKFKIGYLSHTLNLTEALANDSSSFLQRAVYISL